MKKITIYSHTNLQNIKYKTEQYNDEYDSKIVIEDENEHIIYNCDIVNVDSSNKYVDRKVELKNGHYFGIVGSMKRQKKAIMIFNVSVPIEKIASTNDIINNYYSALTLPTVHENPLHNHKNIAVGLWLHDGGFNYDWSAGCITIRKDYYQEFIDHFEMDEIIEIIKK